MGSRAGEKQLVQSNWVTGSNLKHGNQNFLHQSLVNRKDTAFPPLHIKSERMKQFVKVSPTDRDCFKFLILAFPELSFEIINACVFGGPQVWLPVKNFYFVENITELQKNALLAFKNHCHTIYWKL
jgi:hypothetical protein